MYIVSIKKMIKFLKWMYIVPIKKTIKFLKWMYIVQIKKTIKFLKWKYIVQIKMKTRIFQQKFFKSPEGQRKCFNNNPLSPHRDEKNTSTKILQVPRRTEEMFQQEFPKSP